MVEIVYVKEVPGLNPDFFLRWLTRVAEEEGKLLGDICLVLGDDEWLKSYNIQYLNHDYYTDIITFDYSIDDLISGDLLISFDRVLDNAISMEASEHIEFNRVVVHGVLHLCGYRDKSHDELLVMRKKEEYYLSLL